MNIQITGKVVKGERYGRKLGFPTANLDRRQFVKLSKKPKLGVWAGTASFKLNAKSYKLKAGVVIGPLDASKLPKIEAYLLGFKGNLYNKKLTIVLYKYIRPFKKFESEKELKRQIKKDIQLIKRQILIDID